MIENYANGMDYLIQHQNDRMCYVCGKKLEEIEKYMCIFCQDLVERSR